MLYEYYEVFPTSESNLLREILGSSPITIKGRKFAGSTKWNVRWKAEWKRRNGLCKIVKVSTSLKVEYTMPRIAPGHRVTRSVRQAFDEYYASLLAHEKEHMKSGLYAAGEIEKSLMRLTPVKRCSSLDAAANAKVDEIIKKYNKRDKELDRKTNHGQKKSQGTVSIDYHVA